MFGTRNLADETGAVVKLAGKNRFLLVLFLLFFFGVVYGALVISQGSRQLMDTLSFMTDNFLSLRSEQSLLQTFFRSFGMHLGMMAVLYVMGFSAISQPVSLFIPAFYGLGFGLSVGYLYSSMGAKAILVTAVIILPHAMISTVALILAVRESVRLSNLFLAGFVPKLTGSVSLKAVKLYSVKYLILLLFMLLASFVDGIFTFLFARFF